MKTSLQTPFSSYKIRKLEINEKVKSFDLPANPDFTGKPYWRLLMCSKRQMMKTTNT